MRRRRQSRDRSKVRPSRARAISKTVGDPPLARARSRPNHPRSRPAPSPSRVVRATYPLSEVLNTTSPTCVALAPNDRPFHTLPSSRTRRQSRSSHGFFAVALARAPRRVARRVDASASRARASRASAGRASRAASRSSRRRGVKPQRARPPFESRRGARVSWLRRSPNASFHARASACVNICVRTSGCVRSSETTKKIDASTPPRRPATPHTVARHARDVARRPARGAVAPDPMRADARDRESARRARRRRFERRFSID